MMLQLELCSEGRGTVEKLSVGEAATRLGISPDTVRRRIRKGELTAHKELTPPYRWEIELENDQPPKGHDSALTDLLATLQTELAARRLEIQQLHVLLQTAQAALTSPERRPWWRVWR